MLLMFSMLFACLSFVGILHLLLQVDFIFVPRFHITIVFYM